MSSAFNIDQLTDTLYAESCPYSASDRRPLIGISGNYADDRLQLSARLHSFARSRWRPGLW